MIKFEAWCNCEGTGVMPVPFADMYMICKFCDGVGTITIQEEEMEEQESNQAFSYEEYVELKKTYQEVRDKIWEQRAEIGSMRNLVRSFFQERYEESDYEDYFNVDVEDINTLLKDIKSSELAKVYEAGATIELVIKVQAESQDDADYIIRDHLDSVDFTLYGNDNDEFEVESIDVRVSE
jgi:hypothetical protein